jgi:hypothetical protein
VVEGQVKAARAQGAQNGQAGVDLVDGGVAQGRNLEHHLVRVQKLQMPPREGFVRAVDEDELVAQQFLGARVRQGCKNENHVACRRVFAVRARAVEQLMADHGLLGIHDGLARDHGDGERPLSRHCSGCAWCGLGGHGRRGHSG